MNEQRLAWAYVGLFVLGFADMVARGVDSVYGQLFCWIAGG